MVGTSGRIGTYARGGAAATTPQVRVLLGAPQLMMRQALAAALTAHPRLRLVGDVGTGKDALRWALEIRPDVTLLDEALSRVDGVHAATAIHAEDPSLRLVTLHDDEDEQAGDVDDGGSAVAARVSKRIDAQALMSVLARVAEGERPGDVCVALRGAARPARKPADTTLKASERVLLELLVGGGDNRLLAERLGCTEKTVRNRLSELYAKLNLHNRTQAALYAVRVGLVDPGLPRA